MSTPCWTRVSQASFAPASSKARGFSARGTGKISLAPLMLLLYVGA
jgi:hypothetical protein